MGVAEPEAAPQRAAAGVLGTPLTRTAIAAFVALAFPALALQLVRSLAWRGPARPPAFEFLFLRDEPPAALLTVAIVVIAVLAGRARRVPERLFVSSLAADARLFIFCATAVLAASALLVYRAHPLSMDEYAPVFQAHVFARGHLAAQVPPALVPWLVPPFRWFIEASPDGRMVSAYWPGFALLLTPFVWLGVPWLLNPLIGGATLLAIWRIARRLWPDTAAAGWAVLFAAASPALTVNAISFYSMPAHLLASLAFAALLLSPTPRRLFLAGAVGSFALVLHNPLPHALFALPWLGAIALRRGRLRNLALVAAGYLPGIVVLGAGWFRVRAQIGGNVETRQGLGEAVATLSRLALSLPSLGSLWSRSVNLCELVLWAVPLLVPLACIGALRCWRQPGARLIAASALTTLAGYLFVAYDQGHGWGYRYFHAAWGALPLLAAAAVEEPGQPPALRRTAVVAALASLVLCTGLRFSQVRTFIDGQLRQVPSSSASSRLEVVFLRPDRGYYTQDLVQNEPFMDSARWILLSHGAAEDARFMGSFPAARRVLRTDVAELWQVD